MKAKSFRIAVVGAGAIGCYYGAKLAQGGHDVHFLVRGELAEIRIRGKGENLRLQKVNAHASSREMGPCDLVLIAVKATSNGDLPKLISPLLHETTMLLTLQNGFGNEDFLAKNFGAERIMGALCFVCLNRISPGVIEHYDHGRVAIGEFNRLPRVRTHAVVRAFQEAGVICRVVRNLALERWRKLVWNIPFNGLSVAAGGIDTAAILTDKNLRAETFALMNEVIAAAKRCGYPVPAATAHEQMKRTDAMGIYKPSTLLDFQAKRPLELEAIWGEPLRRATAEGAETPKLALLYALLRSIDLNR